MKKYKVVITRVNEYEIEFDEEIYNKEFIDDFKKTFYNFDSLEEHAEHIAQHRARFQQRFIEGYGVPMVNSNEGFLFEHEKESIARGLNINIINEDDFDNMEIEVEEIKDK